MTLVLADGSPLDDRGVKRCFGCGCDHMLVDDGDPEQRCEECKQVAAEARMEEGR